MKNRRDFLVRSAATAAAVPALKGLSAPDAVIYRYKLDRFDHNWQDVGPRREAINTHLGPGHYLFEVMASNGDGH